jgi:outer membrane translocation and assembly module TamA
MFNLLVLHALRVRRHTGRYNAASVAYLAIVALCLSMIAGATAWPASTDKGYPYASTGMSAYKGWTVSSLKVSGVDETLAAGLRKGLVLSGRSKFFGRERASLYSEILLADISRARLYLARLGYPYAVIRPEYKPKPSSRTVEITFAVTPGPPVIVAGVSVTGMPPLRNEEALRPPGISAGAIFTDDSASRTAQSLESRLRHAGYAKAGVEPVVERIDSTNVRLRFDARPGEIHHFGGIIVEGAPADLVPLVKKTVDLKRGSVYSPATVQEAQDYLRLLDLFSRIRLSTLDTGPGKLDIKAELTPRKPRSLELNVGYWTDEFIKVGARWRHRSLFRRGRGLDARASYSQFERRAGVSAGWPAFFGSRTWGAAGVEWERQSEDSYDLNAAKLEISGTYRPTLLTSIRAGVSVSDVDVDVKTEEARAFVEQGGLLTYFSLGWDRNSSDDRLFPTKGTVTWLRAEWAPPGFLSETYYVLLQGSGAFYASLGHGVVTATRVRAGIAGPLSDSKDLLPNKRFFAGGATSMRGFGRRKLGPLDDDGAPLGGESELEASVELRFPILGRIGGAIFVDAGQVWPGGSPFALDELEVAAGPGLVIRTPIGPVRGDIGFRLTDLDDTQPRRAYHIAIGHPF